MGRDYYIKVALQDFIDKIVSKQLHIVKLKDEKGKVQTAPMIKMDNKGQFSLMDEPMKVLASESSASNIVQAALDEPETSELFGSLVRSVSKTSNPEDPGAIKISYILAISELSKELGKEGDPIDEETAAIMAANNMADTISKSAGVPKFGPEISEMMAKMAEDAEASDEENQTAAAAHKAKYDSVYRAGRNIPKVTILPTSGINVYDILKHKNLALTLDAAVQITSRVEG